MLWYRDLRFVGKNRTVSEKIFNKFLMGFQKVIQFHSIECDTKVWAKECQLQREKDTMNEAESGKKWSDLQTREKEYVFEC